MSKSKHPIPKSVSAKGEQSKGSPRTEGRPKGKRGVPGVGVKTQGEITSRGARRRHLDERLQALHHRAIMLEQELRELEESRFYRVCIFGSARIKPDSPVYQEVFTLARYLAWENIDILTGGGPGLMEAANKGAKLGQGEKKSKSLSFGISIELDFEPEPNSHLDVKRHHHRFSSRLDDFMRLSNAVIVTAGGIGTLLELFFTWQLLQVKHIEPRPVVLMDRGYWTGIIDWMKAFPLERGLMSAKDFNGVSIVDTPEEVVEIISAHYRGHREATGGRR
jgi:uncharacterized protein (TIGR00730 family)